MTTSVADRAGSGLLRTARLERGWSQSRVADELTALAAARGVPIAAPASLKTQLSRWENGHAVPELQYRDLLQELYERTAHELGLAPDAGAREDAPLAQLTALGDRLAAAAALDDDGLALLRQQLDAARRVDRRFGAPAARGPVRGQLSYLEQALAHTLRPDRRGRIAVLLAEAALLAGEHALDAAAVADAWRYCETAKSAAREALDPAQVRALDAQAIATQAEVLLDAERPADGVQVARQALDAAGDNAVASLRAALSAVLGRCLAEAGDGTGSRRAFERAERLIAKRVVADRSVPTRLPFIEIDADALHRSRGRALSVLGEPAAVRELELGLRPGDEVPVRDRAAAQADLVIALHSAGRSAEAADHAGVARELASRIGSERVRARLGRALVSGRS